MASRMDRYYQNKTHVARSTKNKDLYKKVQNIDTNDINVVDTIANVNEIDITKRNNVVRNRESYKREKKLRQAMANSTIKFNVPTEKLEESTYDILDINPKKIKSEQKTENKNYDVMDILNKAKDNRDEEEDKNRNLKNLEYKELNSLNLHKKEYKDSEAELKALINTISNTSKLNKLDDDVGLLDELKADTMIGKTSSIKKVLNQQESEVKTDDTKELDKSFFTNTYDFKAEDFDEAFEKKSNTKKIIIIIIISLVVAITILVLYFLGVFNFKINK